MGVFLIFNQRNTTELTLSPRTWGCSYVDILRKTGIVVVPTRVGVFQKTHSFAGVLPVLAPRGAYSVTYTWDDSVVVDRDAQLLTDRQTVNMGAMSKVRYLMRNYGLSEKDAKTWVAEAVEETPEKEDLFNGA